MNVKKLMSQKDRKTLAAGIVFIDGNKILLLMNNNEKWSLPGGHAKYSETPWECAKREVFEETGKKVDDYEHVIKNKDGKMEFHTFFVRAKAFPVRISHEHQDWDWIDVRKIKKLDLPSKFKKNWKNVKDILDGHFGIK